MELEDEDLIDANYLVFVNEPEKAGIYQSFLHICGDLCFNLQLLLLFKEPVVLCNCHIELYQPDTIDLRSLFFFKLDYNRYVKPSAAKLNFQQCGFTVGELAVFWVLTLQVGDLIVFKHTRVQIRMYRANVNICVRGKSHDNI